MESVQEYFVKDSMYCPFEWVNKSELPESKFSVPDAKKFSWRKEMPWRWWRLLWMLICKYSSHGIFFFTILGLPRFSSKTNEINFYSKSLWLQSIWKERIKISIKKKILSKLLITLNKNSKKLRTEISPKDKKKKNKGIKRNFIDLNKILFLLICHLIVKSHHFSTQKDKFNKYF